MKIQLSKTEKLKLEKQHKKEKNSKIADRIKAVLLSSEGWTQSQISQALRLHETTVATHIQDYLNKNKLKNECRGSQSYFATQETMI